MTPTGKKRRKGGRPFGVPRHMWLPDATDAEVREYLGLYHDRLRSGRVDPNGHVRQWVRRLLRGGYRWAEPLLAAWNNGLRPHPSFGSGPDGNRYYWPSAPRSLDFVLGYLGPFAGDAVDLITAYRNFCSAYYDMPERVRLELLSGEHRVDPTPV